MIGIQPARVLLVEDDPADRALFMRMAAEVNLTVEWAGSLDEARRVLEHRRGWRALFIDMVLGDGNGCELLGDLSCGRTGAPMPTVVLSSCPMALVEKEAILAGADEVLDKNELSGSAIETVLRRAALRYLFRRRGADARPSRPMHAYR